MGQRGQASVEWCALLLAVAAALTGTGVLVVRSVRARAAATVARVTGAPAPSAPRARVARTPASVPDLADLALARRDAPGLVYERGMRDHPVDPRECRARACAEAPGPATLFTHVVHRGATTYVQYWEYFPDPSWNGIAGRHADDWESYQVRVNPDGTVDARASAHHGYTGRRYGWDLNLSQVRPFARGWTRTTGWLRIGNRSHAGYLTSGPHGRRFTPAAEVRLVPIETAGLPEDYAISSPWRKVVYSDPESPRT